jgi:hypothetical protein
MLLKSMEMERVLAEAFPGKTLDEFFAQQRSEVEANVDNAKKTIVDTIMGQWNTEKCSTFDEKCSTFEWNTMKSVPLDGPCFLIEKAKAVKKCDAAGGNKFTAELRGGTVETFLGGVTGLVGEPHPEIERGMAEEHLDKPDSHTGFTASNYPTTSTPAIEFAVVLTAMGITTGPASKTLKKKLEPPRTAWLFDRFIFLSGKEKIVS